MWRISSKRDIQTWAENTLDVDTAGAKSVAQAIWDRPDFPHPVNNTDLTSYLAGLPDDWLAAQGANVECAYCGAMVPGDDSVPAVNDDVEWARLSVLHGDGCEWCQTRAHRGNLPANV